MKDWSAIVLSVAAVAAVFYGYAKSLVHLNGLGDRVRELETADAAQGARLNKIEREQERAADDRQRLHEQVGESKHAAEECNDSTNEMKADVIGAINDMRLEVTNSLGALRERVKAIEVAMELRNHNHGGR